MMTPCCADNHPGHRYGNYVLFFNISGICFDPEITVLWGSCQFISTDYRTCAHYAFVVGRRPGTPGKCDPIGSSPMTCATMEDFHPVTMPMMMPGIIGVHYSFYPVPDDFVITFFTSELASILYQ
jgi:hypothetical protein